VNDQATLACEKRQLCRSVAIKVDFEVCRAIFDSRFSHG
jgi:hypothetical protein